MCQHIIYVSKLYRVIDILLSKIYKKLIITCMSLLCIKKTVLLVINLSTPRNLELRDRIGDPD